MHFELLHKDKSVVDDARIMTQYPMKCISTFQFEIVTLLNPSENKTTDTRKEHP